MTFLPSHKRIMCLCDRRGVYCCYVASPYVCLLVLGSASYLTKYSLRNLFIFCINVDIDKMLLSDKNKGLGINSFTVI